MAYWQALRRHLGDSAIDVFLLTLFGLMPLIFARLEPLARGARSSSVWGEIQGVFNSGQLSLYTVTTLATIVILCLRSKLPPHSNILVGATAALGLTLIAWLIGIDPTFANASRTFVGPLSGWLFLLVQLGSVFILAAAKVDLGDISPVAESQTQELSKRLKSRRRSQK